MVFFMSLNAIAQEFSSVNYFNNLSVANPAAPQEHSSLVHFTSNTFYNTLPAGVNSSNLLTSHRLNKSIAFSGYYTQYNLGKVQSRHVVQFAGSYLKQMLGYTLSLGLGFQWNLNRFDETRLTTDFENYNYQYGTDVFTQSGIRVPFGLSLTGQKNELQAYYHPGVGVSSNYGLILGRQVFRKKVQKVMVKNDMRLAIYHDLLNPKISFENRLEIENFGFQIFGNQNLTSNVVGLNTQMGIGVSYLWKVFDLNYSIATNSNGLGLNHQLGVQVFIER